MPDRVPRRRPEISDGIMALVKTVASSTPIIASPKEISTTGIRSCCPGTANHKPHSPTTRSAENPPIQGFRGCPVSAMAPSTGPSAAAMSWEMPVA